MDDLLYHYTNQEGLNGILSSQNLWATHYSFLNDTSESSVFKSPLYDVLSLKLENQFKALLATGRPQDKQIIEKEGGLKSIAEKDARTQINWLHKFISEDGGYYLTSFSEGYKKDFLCENGLLSQWRAYGVNGGYCIIFEKEKIVISAKGTGSITLPGNVSYTKYIDDIFRTDLENLSEFSSRMMEGRLNSINPKSIFTDEENNRIHISLLSLCSLIKHHAFYEENEYRIVVKPSKDTKILFRDKNGLSVPYINLYKQDKAKLPIKRIIVGPHADKEKRAIALKTKLQDTGIEVTVSDIPFV